MKRSYSDDDDWRSSLRDVRHELHNLANSQQGFAEMLGTLVERTESRITASPSVERSTRERPAHNMQLQHTRRPGALSDSLRRLQGDSEALEFEADWLRQQLESRTAAQPLVPKLAIPMGCGGQFANFQGDFGLEEQTARSRSPRPVDSVTLKVNKIFQADAIHEAPLDDVKMLSKESPQVNSNQHKKNVFQEYFSSSSVSSGGRVSTQKLKNDAKSQIKQLKKAKQPMGSNSMKLSPFDFREKVRRELNAGPLGEDRWYKRGGIWQHIAKHHRFEQMTLTVISTNALWIWVDTDLNHAEVLLDAHWAFQFMENFFCTYFLIEWIIRYQALGIKKNGFKEKWFVFDTMLVTMTVLETWMFSFFIFIASAGSDSPLGGNTAILRMARLLRLSRMGRMARLIRAVPELAILIKGMMASVRSVLTTLLLLVVIMYIFGIAFAQLTVGTDAKKTELCDWSTVTNSMYTLWLYGVLCLDYAQEISTELRDANYLLFIAYYVFVFLALFTVLNMLIGVLCEVVTAVASSEKEAMMLNYCREKLSGILQTLDTDMDGYVSKEEFGQLLTKPEACNLLRDLGIDVLGLLDFRDVIFDMDENAENTDSEGYRQLDFQEFLDLIIQLRGSNHATVKDILELRKVVNTTFTIVNDIAYSMQKSMQRLSAIEGGVGSAGDVDVTPRTLDECRNYTNDCVSTDTGGEATILGILQSPARPVEFVAKPMPVRKTVNTAASEQINVCAILQTIANKLDEQAPAFEKNTEMLASIDASIIKLANELRQPPQALDRPGSGHSVRRVEEGQAQSSWARCIHHQVQPETKQRF